MVFGKSRLEFKVGIFVLVGIVILFIFVMMIGDFKNSVSAYKVKFVFNFINGVKVGAPVLFAGVDVGHVKEITIVSVPGEQITRVELIGLIRKDIRMPVDSQVWVNTLGLLGEKYIDVIPGKDYNNYVRENAVMAGNNPMAMHEFGELAKSIATKLDQSMDDIKTLTDSIASFAKNIDDGVTRIKNKEGTVGKLLYDDALYNELEGLVTDIKKHPWKLFRQPREKAEPKKSKK